jgi:hypothetical protein
MSGPLDGSTVELGYNDIEGTETFESLQPSVAVSDVCGESEGKYVKTKYRPAGTLLKFPRYGLFLISVTIII